jgi:hypothetical protein
MLKCTTRRRSCANTRNTYSTWKRIVGTVKKSTDTVFGNLCSAGSHDHAAEAGGDPFPRSEAQDGVRHFPSQPQGRQGSLLTAFVFLRAESLPQALRPNHGPSCVTGRAFLARGRKWIRPNGKEKRLRLGRYGTLPNSEGLCAPPHAIVTSAVASLLFLDGKGRLKIYFLKRTGDFASTAWACGDGTQQYSPRCERERTKVMNQAYSCVPIVAM